LLILLNRRWCRRGERTGAPSAWAGCGVRGSVGAGETVKWVRSHWLCLATVALTVGCPASCGYLLEYDARRTAAAQLGCLPSDLTMVERALGLIESHMVLEGCGGTWLFSCFGQDGGECVVRPVTLMEDGGWDVDARARREERP
jgi:hypothetical protein